jgi:nucleotide-binding universal stress UspA family protein
VTLRAPELQSRSSAVEYRRILVPLVPGEASEQAMSIACQLAAERGASVTALTVIEVPSELPLDCHMLDEEEAAKRLLAEAHAIGDSCGVSVVPRVVRARAAGPAIVEAASSDAAEIIVLRAPRRGRASRRAPIFGLTVDHLLKHAPCRVMVAAPQAEA